MSRVEHVGREIIENKLLATLEDDEHVAIVLSRKDIDALMGAFMGKLKLTERQVSMLKDLAQLRSGAFGQHGMQDFIDQYSEHDNWTVVENQAKAWIELFDFCYENGMGSYIDLTEEYGPGSMGRIKAWIMELKKTSG